MLAYHPVTGKEIRIVQSDASLWKEKKTLAWNKGQHTIDTPWDTVSFDVQIPATYSVALKYIEPEELVQRCKQSRLVFLEKSKNPDIDADILRKYKINNLICLEEMKDLYPNLGDVWDGSEMDAVVLVAGLLRYRFLANFPELTERVKQLHLTLESANTPAPLYWCTQYYHPEKAKRKREIDLCLENNVKSSRIHHILLLNEQKMVLPPSAAEAEASGRLTQRVIGHRLTYMDVLSASLSLPDNAILAFANADICIDDDSWRQLWSVNLMNRCLALLRWDVPVSGNLAEAKLFGPRADSQDTWVVRVADIKAAYSRSAFKTITGIPFGQMGCDNAFALEMFRAKFAVINPARTLKTYHVHASEVRTYDVKNVVERPVFLYIHPSGFHDLEPVIHQWPEKSVIQKLNSKTLTRKLEGSGAQAWMEAQNRTLAIGEESWTRNGLHLLKTVPEVILQKNFVWQTEEGLCYDQERMYIGPAERAQRVWSESMLRSLSPCIESGDAVVVPFVENTMKLREEYILRYLSKVIRLRELSKNMNAEFLCPESKEFIDVLHMFDWGAPRIPVLKYEKDQQVYCRSATILPVSDNIHILPEDISNLRLAVRGWESAPLKPHVLVLIEDGKVLTTEIVQKLEEELEQRFVIRVVYPGRTSAERYWDCIRGAWGVVFGSSITAETWGWNWLLPKSAYVFEVGHASVDPLNLSAAADLQHRFVKTPDDVVQEVNFVAAPLAEDGDIIWIPRKDLEGYFAHAGDSFREMARLWSERGYVKVKEHPTATMCWWGAVGQKGVLLYDRPTHEWRLAAPGAESKCTAALYGNPTPPEGVAKRLPMVFLASST
jgi:hypothetical protein